MAATVGLCLVALFEARKVRFDYNLIKMQSPNLASVVFEHKLINSADKSLLYGAVVATNLDHAIAMEGTIRKLPTVADIEPPPDMLSDFLEPNQREKLGLIRRIKQEVAPLKFSAPDLKPVNVNESEPDVVFTLRLCRPGAG